MFGYRPYASKNGLKIDTRFGCIGEDQIQERQDQNKRQKNPPLEDRWFQRIRTENLQGRGPLLDRRRLQQGTPRAGPS
jgi:hypothetical protein